MQRKHVAVLIVSLVGFSSVVFVGALGTTAAKAVPPEMLADGPFQSDAQASVAISSTFTYQGQLRNGGSPANATCDIAFRLYDNSSAGVMIGAPITAAVTIANGMFTQPLNFGTGVFTSTARWLEMAVRCPAGSGPFTPLSPRQALSAAPYALYSAAPWATKIDGSLSYTSGNVGIGTSAPAHRLSLIGGPGWTTNNWLGALELSNASAIAWQANPGQTRFGLGQTTGGLYIFHTASNPGTMGSPAIYDMMVSDSGKVGIGTIGPNYPLHVFGNSTAIYGEGGVYGTSNTQVGVFGASGSGPGVEGTSVGSIGVFGFSNAGDGIHGSSGSGYAGRFNGNVRITGSCCAAPMTFSEIDHPADPANQVLRQALVESPDMKNIYDGNVTTDAKGDATVTLPKYVDALNGDFRYQLTVIGQFAQAIVATRIKDGRFTIKTDKPNVDVSWQVTGIRKDPYAVQNRVQPEVAKPATERGTYLHPEAYGLPETLGADYGKQPIPKRDLPSVER